jgi:CubicO group peptidase (beta-lactamase class C family)/pimeloyl-ACP methyl ester carboxylesterase
MMAGARSRAGGLRSATPDFGPLDERLRDRVARGYFDGMGLIVGRGDAVLHETYVGEAGPQSVVHVASVGKWTAAATLAAVVVEGKLSWSDPARKFIPELTDSKGDATLRQLLSHTAGYPDYQPEGRRRDDYPSLAEAVAHIVDLPADAPPGTKFQYGGLAMQVAGRMAELATGATFDELFQSRVARPLGMTKSGFTPVSREPGFSPMLGGSLFTTTRDYAAFLKMIAARGVYGKTRILTAAVIEELEHDQVRSAALKPLEYVDCARAEARHDVYGLGQWREEVDSEARATLLSSPGWAGAYAWCDRRFDLWGVVLAKANLERAKADGYNTFLGSTVYAPLARAAVRDAARPDLKGRRIGKLYVEERGVGEPVVFLHGHSFDRTQWDPQFDALSSRHRVIRYDLRGYGRSADPGEGEAFRHVDDLAGLLDDLGLPKAHLVGLSLGGFVVTDFLALHPGRVLSATMAGGDLFDVPGPSEPITAAEIRRRQDEIAVLKTEGLFAFKRRWLDGLVNGAGSGGATIKPRLWRMIDAWRAWQPLNVEPRLLLGRDAKPALLTARPSAPVLIVRGDRETANLAITSLLPAARIEVLTDCGHVSNLERPDPFTAVLVDHILRGSGGV